MTELNVREAGPADQEAIREATLSAYQEYAPVMGPGWDRYRSNILETLADVSPAEQIVAESGGAIVGTVLMYPAGTTFGAAGGEEVRLADPEIRLLAVPPAGRGRGVGKALMLECLRRGRQAGNSAITLHTTDMMQVAKQMYERMGFARAPELDFSPAPGFVIKGYRYTFENNA